MPQANKILSASIRVHKSISIKYRFPFNDCVVRRSLPSKQTTRDVITQWTKTCCLPGFHRVRYLAGYCGVRKHDLRSVIIILFFFSLIIRSYYIVIFIFFINGVRDTMPGCRYKSSGRAQLNAITTYIFSNSQFVPPFRLLPGSSYTTWNNSIRHPRPRPHPSAAVLDPVAASTSLPRRQDLCVKGLLNCQRPRPSTIECNGPTTEPLQGVCVCTSPEEHNDDEPGPMQRPIFHRLYFSSLNEPNDSIFSNRNR